MASTATSRSTSLTNVSATSSRFAATATAHSYTGRSRPRTAATSSAFRNEIICAVSEGRSVCPTVGLSFVNLSTCEAVLCQFADTQTYARTCHKIHVFDPSEILFPETIGDSKLLSIVKENLDVDQNRITMTSLRRRYWDENTGHDHLRQFALPDDYESLKLSLAGKFFATCCFAAVRKPGSCRWLCKSG